jgi:replication-associated recombination protein RarA
MQRFIGSRACWRAANPIYILRRLTRAAVEDITGLADPQASSRRLRLGDT